MILRSLRSLSIIKRPTRASSRCPDPAEIGPLVSVAQFEAIVVCKREHSLEITCAHIGNSNGPYDLAPLQALNQTQHKVSHLSKWEDGNVHVRRKAL